MLANDLGVLVVGHGTRKPNGQAQLLQLVEHMRQSEPRWIIEPSFLELATPTIEQAIAKLSSQQVRRIIVVPILLFSAAHAKSDIPDAVQASAREHRITVVAQTPSLGTNPEVIALSNRRYLEITAQASQEGCPEGHCGHGLANPCGRSCTVQGKTYHRIALAMVGRGTSDLEALEHMRQFTHLANSQRSTKWVLTGFFAGGKPTVDELFEQAAVAKAEQEPCDAVVIQPHLLFEGELMDQLRSKIVQYRQEYPDRHWVLSRSLGADCALAEVFIQFVRTAAANV
jgi:sirohydrochlorin cobaltochelatase